MRTLDVLNPGGASEWDALVEQHPNATVFHTSAWAKVVHETYGHRPLYLYFHSADNAVALIPLIEVLSPLTGRRAVCVPFSDACGPPLFCQGVAGVIRAELASLGRQRAWNYIEIRGDELLDSRVEPAATYYGHGLDLSASSEALFASFAEATRRAIRRATKNNLSAEVSDQAKAVEAFYRLQLHTRKKHGLPPQPFRFFANVYRHLIKPGSGFTVLVRAGDQIAAAAIFLREGSRAIYKFAASDPELIKTRGNNLVMWEGIRHLITQGCDKLHLGRTSLENRGLRAFKLSWGTEEHMIRYYRFEVRKRRSAAQPIRSRESGLHQRLFRNLPQGINRLVGAMIYPHLD